MSIFYSFIEENDKKMFTKNEYRYVFSFFTFEITLDWNDLNLMSIFIFNVIFHIRNCFFLCVSAVASSGWYLFLLLFGGDFEKIFVALIKIETTPNHYTFMQRTNGERKKKVERRGCIRAKYKINKWFYARTGFIAYNAYSNSSKPFSDTIWSLDFIQCLNAIALLCLHMNVAPHCTRTYALWIGFIAKNLRSQIQNNNGNNGHDIVDRNRQEMKQHKKVSFV